MVKTIPLSNETHTLLKKYCASKGKFLSHAGDQIIRSFLETQHNLIESEGEMIIEGEREKPKTIVEVLKEEQEEEEEGEPRRSLKDFDVVRKGNRYIVKKKREAK